MLPGATVPGSAPPKVATLPATLVDVQVSRKYLRQFVDSAVDSDDPVTDFILGTTITGKAHTSGTADLVLESDSHQARARVTFVGTAESRTEGRNGPVILYSDGHTEFEASKQLVWDSSGFRTLPATSTAQMVSATTSIESTLPGLRGRIVERVAWKRADETRPQVEAIAARHAEERINRALDQRVELSVATVRTMFAMKAPQFQYPGDTRPPVVQFSSTPSHLRMVMFRSEATLAQRELLPPPIEGDPDLVVRIHRSVVARSISEPGLMGPLVSQVLSPKVGQTASVKTGKKSPDYHFTWSADHTWLLVHFTAPSPPATLSVKAN